MTEINQQQKISLHLARILKRAKLKQLAISIIELTLLVCTFIALHQLLLKLSYFQIHQALLFSILISIALVCGGFYFFALLSAIKRLSMQNYVEHLNRVDSQFEESAQLLVVDNQKLNRLQIIQKKKIARYIEQCLKQNSGTKKTLIPQLNLKRVSYLAGLTLLLLIFYSNIADLLLKLDEQGLSLSANHGEANTRQNHTDKTDANLAPVIAAQLLSSTVIIKPPAYTQLPKTEVADLNFNVLQNSQVEWRLTIKNPTTASGLEQAAPSYFFIDSAGKQQPLIFNSQGYYYFSKTLKQTVLYRIGYYQNQQLVSLSDSHSIKVTMDRPPKLSIIQPKQSLIEIAKDGKAEFELLVLAKDDFALSEVKILASVAKGSGEAVKFRDKQFEFDVVNYQQEQGHYYKHWKLSDLDMEPGDEVYIKVLATDNRQPAAQQTKSATVIVRWQDENSVETVTEGLQIGFVAEYFRSQRQIIIETEALIADQGDMQQAQIDQISRDLGHSQADLKQRYGQYLGDEFGDGEQDHSHDLGASLGNGFGLADGYHGGEEGTGSSTLVVTDGKNKNEHQHKHQENDHGDANKTDTRSNNETHQHSSESANQIISEPSDITGKAALIAQFAHNHSQFEVGPLSKLDPKSWMKLAVNEMWQAEMHLMLSQPKRALPFEYRAYQYFKQARKAERVYAKRLGFEPPPVDESRRLTGELDDIKAQTFIVKDSDSTAETTLLYKKAYHLLNQLADKETLSREAIDLLIQLKKQLLNLATSRPVMLQYATKVEKMIFSLQSEIITQSPNEASFDKEGSLNKVNRLNKGNNLLALINNDCFNCVAKLKQKIWQLLPSTKSKASVQVGYDYWSDDEKKKYLQQLIDLKNTQGNQ